MKTQKQQSDSMKGFVVGLIGLILTLIGIYFSSCKTESVRPEAYHKEKLKEAQQTYKKHRERVQIYEWQHPNVK